MIVIVPCDLEEANVFVQQFHRHHPPVRGYKFAVSAWTNRYTVACATVDHPDIALRPAGVAIVGRPVARHLQNGTTLEVTRNCTDSTRHVASKLYAACWNAARAMGYLRMVTYTLAGESGASARAAGFKMVARVKGASWHRDARPRIDVSPTQDKFRYEVPA